MLNGLNEPTLKITTKTLKTIINNRMDNDNSWSLGERKFEIQIVATEKNERIKAFFSKTNFFLLPENRRSRVRVKIVGVYIKNETFSGTTKIETTGTKIVGLRLLITINAMSSPSKSYICEYDAMNGAPRPRIKAFSRLLTIK